MPPVNHNAVDAAEAVVAVAPPATRWIERLLAGHDPPLTVPQHLALSATGRDRRVRAPLRF